MPRRADLVALKRGLTASGANVLALTPLPPPAVARLAARLAGADRIGDGLRRVAEQAGGNPLYLEDLVTALVAERRVTVRDATDDDLTEDDLTDGCLTAELTDAAHHTLLARKTFTASAPAASYDAPGAVQGFDAALGTLLGDVTHWLDDAGLGTR